MELADILGNFSGAPVSAPVNSSVVEVVTDALSAAFSDDITTDPAQLRASKLYEECPRKWLILKAQNGLAYTSHVGPGLGVCFGIGHGIHKMIQRKLIEIAFKRTVPLDFAGGWECRACGGQYSTYFATDLPSRCQCGKSLGPSTLKYSEIGGDVGFARGLLPIAWHVDGWLRLHKEHYVLEIKSTNDYTFTHISAKTLPLSYQWQANVYMRGSGIDQTLYMYVNKAKFTAEKLPIKCFVYKRDPVIMAQIDERVNQLTGITNGAYDGMDISIFPRICRGRNIIRDCPAAGTCMSGVV